MKFTLATLAAVAAVAQASSKTATIKDVTAVADDNTVTASMKWDATYSKTENSAGGQDTVSIFKTTVTKTLTKEVDSDEEIEYLVCANVFDSIVGTCYMYSTTDSTNTVYQTNNDFSLALPTDVASANTIFTQGAASGNGWQSINITFGNSKWEEKWDAAKKVFTSVQTYDDSGSLSKEGYAAYKLAISKVAVIAAAEPVVKSKTTIVSAVRLESGNKVTAFATQEVAESPFDLMTNLQNPSVNGASALALGAVAVAVATLAF